MCVCLFVCFLVCFFVGVFVCLFALGGVNHDPYHWPGLMATRKSINQVLHLLCGKPLKLSTRGLVVSHLM